MSPSSNRHPAGFTLVEMLVVLATLGMILWMVGELFFPMSQAAERQRLQVEARQTARAASDYVQFLVRGASDMNEFTVPPNPLSVIAYFYAGAPPGGGTTFPACPGDAGCRQASFNNVADGSLLATPGTDIVTIATPGTPERLSPVSGTVNLNKPSPTWWIFNYGCPTGGAAGDSLNFSTFKSLTDPNNTSPSPPLILVDATGTFFYQISNYFSSDNANSCSNPDPVNCQLNGSPVPCIKVEANPSPPIGVPGGPATVGSTPLLIVGARFVALRVCNGWLEQKGGIFDPIQDANCPSLAAGAEFPPYQVKNNLWQPLLPNVEDFQVAYLLLNASIWNSAVQTLAAGQGCPDGVPGAGTSTSNWDETKVVGMRITVTARSSVAAFGGGKIPGVKPAAEDGPEGTVLDTYYRYQVSATVLLRNRLAGS